MAILVVRLEGETSWQHIGRHIQDDTDVIGVARCAADLGDATTGKIQLGKVGAQAGTFDIEHDTKGVL